MAEEIKDTQQPQEQPEGRKKPETPDTQAQIQDLMTEVAKLKRSLDKASSEAADYKKKWKTSLSEQEQASVEKAEKEAEREEQFKRLLRENQTNKLEKEFLKLGYSDEQALKAAEAQYDGDVDTLFKIQQEVQQSKIKQAEADWLNSRPEIRDNPGKEKTEDEKLAEIFKKSFGGF